MQFRRARSFLYDLLALALLLPLGLVSCTSGPVLPDKPAVLFPPQLVMEHGDYARFVAENQQALGQCAKAVACATALFNLGFVHAYPRSPSYDPAKALQYLGTLHARYPQTPLDMQGQIWVAFIHDKLALEETQRRLQADLRTQEATIRSLQGRLKRARDIDLQIDKKERDLLR
jgi:hypothetical protein